MNARVAFLGVAHVHAGSYAHVLSHRVDADVCAVWDRTPSVAEAFAGRHGCCVAGDPEAALANATCAIVASENTLHADLIEACARRGVPVMCEKPLVASLEDAERVRAAVRSGAWVMTAFPCRFSPVFERLKARLAAREVGEVRAICATNRGRCPGGWFVEAEWSGGGAMIDHVVHVADLLYVLLGEEPSSVSAGAGHNLHGKEWEDSALLTLDYPSGVFATLDSSWSRPASYKTWGDVMLTVTGDEGVAEADLFGAAVDLFRNDATPGHVAVGYGSDCDARMVAAFLRAVETGAEPPVSAEDGLRAARVALAGYASLRAAGPVPVPV